MHLDKLAVSVFRALLIRGGDGATRADHRIRRLAEDQARTACRDDHGVRGKRFELERLQVHRDQSATDLMTIEHKRQHLPMLKLSYFAVDFVATHLLVERIEQLLPG